MCPFSKIAEQFCGSRQAWERNGYKYAASIFFAVRAKAVSMSPVAALYGAGLLSDSGGVGGGALLRGVRVGGVFPFGFQLFAR